MVLCAIAAALGGEAKYTVGPPLDGSEKLLNDEDKTEELLKVLKNGGKFLRENLTNKDGFEFESSTFGKNDPLTHGWILELINDCRWEDDDPKVFKKTAIKVTIERLEGYKEHKLPGF